MRLDDAPALLAVYGDADAMRHLTLEPPRTTQEALAWVRSKVELFEADSGLSLWTVQHRPTGRVVGDIGLQHEDYGWGTEIGLGGRGSREFWHDGLATEAARAVVSAGFASLPIERICAETAPGNLPAQRLLERLGMVRIGHTTTQWPVYAITREALSARSER
jgi:RimJ/RimL family protein N-acetyltransferase